MLPSPGHNPGAGWAMRWRLKAILLVSLLSLSAPVGAAPGDADYPWLAQPATGVAESVAQRFNAPPGFVRERLAPESFDRWLRLLPLQPAGTPVRLFDGRRKARQDLHAAVVDIDVGRIDLQQCADAVIRLRAEYLFARSRDEEMAFDFTSGDRLGFARWTAGWRPIVDGAKVRWRQGAANTRGHESLRRYLHTIFMYAGTYSLSRQMMAVARHQSVRIGDVYLEGGFPGHAMIVVDRTVNPATGMLPCCWHKATCRRRTCMSSPIPADRMIRGTLLADANA